MFPVKDAVRDTEHQCPMVSSLVSVPILQKVFICISFDSQLMTAPSSPCGVHYLTHRFLAYRTLLSPLGMFMADSSVVPLDLQSLLPLEIWLIGLGGVYWHRLEGVTVQCLISLAAMAALEHTVYLFETRAVLLAFWFHDSQKTCYLGVWFFYRWACGTTVTCVSIGLLWEITLHNNLRSNFFGQDEWWLIMIMWPYLLDWPVYNVE